MKTHTYIPLTLLALFVNLFPASVSAQNIQPEQNCIETPQGIKCEVDLPGKVRKPSVTYLIARESAGQSEGLELKEDLVGHVAKAVTEGPF
ncbi:MAG: hypothetical protein ACKO6N_24635 [Myxococcota bacterium]